MTTPQPLKPEQLRQTIDPARIPYRHSDEARAFTGVLGQERAMTAMRTALGIDQEGYNLFVCGPTGVGKHSLVLQHLRERAAAMPRADDWLYVANFRERGRPQAIRLPAGEGRRFQEAMRNLLASLAAAIPRPSPANSISSACRRCAMPNRPRWTRPSKPCGRKRRRPA